MFACRWTTLTSVVLIGVVSACHPSGYAFLQPQHHLYPYYSTSEVPLASRDTVPESSVTLPVTISMGTIPAAQPPSDNAVSRPVIQPQLAHIRNPDASTKKPTKRWLTQSGLLASTATTYVYERPTALVAKRRTPVLAQGAFAGGLLSYAASTLSAAGGWMWIIATTLPLLTALVGVAGLTKISRNREQYRGKGWAISAILLGTGVLGMIWVALFALASSNIIWG